MRDEHLFATPDEARRIMLDHVRLMDTERVRLAGALGRVLRAPILSDIDYPRSDVSSMDGYCLASEGTAGASGASPLRFPVRGKSTPGAEPPRCEPGTCVLITTGAPLAKGADAVARYEDVTEHGEGGEVKGEVTSIDIRKPVPPANYVRRQGEVIRKGDAVLEPGALVTPQALGILASFAAGPYEVSRRPRAAVLATGDELLPSGAALGPYSIRDSNSPTLAGMLESAGCDVAVSESAGDNQEVITGFLDDRGDCDVVMISGGVSGGRFDFVPACLERIGARIILRGVKMTPGKPVLFALRGDTAYFGVPGNPVSAVVSLLMLIRPFILAMLGRTDYLPVSIEARCSGAITRKTPYVTFTPGLLTSDMVVTPMRFLGSGDIMSLAGANALISIPEDRDEVAAGDVARVYPFDLIKQGGEA
ncbi:MAG: molybdopterin molybdotransferase MoeA [bacterium]|jgi:molybdopterin molybdotransferase